MPGIVSLRVGTPAVGVGFSCQRGGRWASLTEMEQLPVPSKPSLPVAPPTLPPPAPTGRDPHPGLVIALPLLALGLFSSGATTWFGTDAASTAGTHAAPTRPVPSAVIMAIETFESRFKGLDGHDHR